MCFIYSRILVMFKQHPLRSWNPIFLMSQLLLLLDIYHQSVLLLYSWYLYCLRTWLEPVLLWSFISLLDALSLWHLQQGTTRMPGIAITKSVVANEPGGRKREEIFVDVIEKISITFSSSVSNSFRFYSNFYVLQQILFWFKELR